MVNIMDFIVCALVLCVVLIVSLAWLFVINRNWNSLPPYSTRFPLIGNIYKLLSLKKKEPLHVLFGKIAKELGPVFTMWFGDLPIIIINDYENAKKVLNSSNFAGRPQRLSGDIVSRGFKGIVITDYNDMFKKRRRIAFKSFQRHDKSLLDSILNYEANSLVERLQSKLESNHILEIKTDVSLTTFNVLWKLLFNRRIEKENKEYDTIMSMMKDLTVGLESANITSAFPMSKYMPNCKFNLLYKFRETRDKLITMEFKKHMKDVISNNNNNENCVQDFIDILMLEKELEYNEKEMIISDMIVAGFLTTANAVNFTIMYLLQHPNIIQKCISEINRILQNGVAMSLDLVSDFHYINAVISEALRLRPVVPINLPHQSIKNDVIKDYAIPSRTTILINMYSVHHDEKVFPNAEDFIPERFLDSDGNYKKGEGYIPFSTGRRECLGKKLAEKEMTYLLVALLKNFELEIPPKQTIDMDPIITSTLTPKPYLVKIKKRETLTQQE